MRKIVVYQLLSLDGVAEEPSSFFADWDDALEANLAAEIAIQDAVVLGRRSYTEWAQYTSNVASARVLEKLGFVREGTLREDCVVNGEVSDSWIFGILRREWRPWGTRWRGSRRRLC